MPTTLPSPAIPQVLPTSSSATFVRGVQVAIECPSWCVVDHASDDLSCITDLHHYGEQVSLPVPQWSGPSEPVLLARLVQWPFSPRGGEPRMELAADDGSDPAALDPAAALAFADQLVAHAEQIRRTAAVLGTS